MEEPDRWAHKINQAEYAIAGRVGKGTACLSSLSLRWLYQELQEEDGQAGE